MRSGENTPGEGIIISVGMQKGGVAKTTNTLHLAAALAERGHRVLLWDVDENYGATKVFGVPVDDVWATMDILTGECGPEEAILESGDETGQVALPPNLDFIPSSRALQGIERNLSAADGFYNANDCLKPHIAALQRLGRYDFIFIDTGPHASATTRSAYMVSDYFILSLTPEKQAIASLPDALRDVVNARRPDRNPRLHLLGLILSCVDRRLSLAKRYEEAIDSGFLDREGRRVKFETTISTAAAIDRAYQDNTLVLRTEPSHRVSGQYRALAQEVESRIAAHRRRTKNAEPATPTMAGDGEEGAVAYG
jgi:chromosome partitioning protein